MFNPLRPWRHPLRLLRTVGFVLTALPVGVLAFGTIVALLATSAGLLITFVLAVPFAWLLFVWSRAMGHVERSRVDALMDVPHRRPRAAAAGEGLAAPPRRARRRRACGGRRSPSTSPACPSPSWRSPSSWRRGAARSPWSCCRRTSTSCRASRRSSTSSRSPPAAAPRWPRSPASSALLFIAPWITVGMGRMELGAGQGAARAELRGGARRPGDAARDEPQRRPSTAPRPSAGASSATCTTAPSSASSPWRPTWVPHARSSTTTRSRRDARWWRSPTRRRSRRCRRSATSSAASTR